MNREEFNSGALQRLFCNVRFHSRVEPFFFFFFNVVLLTRSVSDPDGSDPDSSDRVIHRDYDYDG